jgi:hypothetical protein
MGFKDMYVFISYYILWGGFLEMFFEGSRLIR